MPTLTNDEIARAMRYAVSRNDDGGVVLTVFEHPNAATIELSAEWVKMLVGHLNGDGA